ncbi:MAG TPA: hypothetical protein VNQ90_02140 [Chthoniobacteraceae bacterium]|nr:hypothetical protein [Chthoniobacteraceae bacterium]
MKTVFTLSVVTLALAASPLSKAIEIKFDSPETFATQWPTISTTGEHSSATLLEEPDRLLLRGEGTMNAQTSIYTSSDLSSEFDFLSEAKTFTFHHVALTWDSTGATYMGNFGVMNGSGGSLQQGTGPDYGVYFKLNRNTQELELYLKFNGSNSMLSSWAPNGYQFADLSLTLSSTSWSVVSTEAGLSDSGTFATGLDALNWGGDFHLGLQAIQTSSVAARNSDLTLTGITVVPEPGAMVFTGVGLGMLIWSCRRRFRGSLS